MADGDGSILDFLTNNWSSILGGNPASPAPQPPQWAMPASPQAPQASPTMATAQGVINPPPGVLSGQPFSSSGAVGPNPLTGGDPTTMASLNGGVLPAPAPGPGSPTPQMPDATLANMQPNPSGPPGANPPPPVSTAPPPPSVSDQWGTPAGTPIPGPLNINPNAGGVGAPPTNQTGLARLLGAGGIPPIFQQRDNTIPAALAALGKGLSTVGGNTAGGAFSRGMGGALTGGTEFQQQQEKDDLAKRKMFMDETIAGDNQAMKGKMFPLVMQNLARRNDAMAASTANMLKNGGNGNSWFTSDIGRIHLADQETDAWKKQEIQTIKSMNDAGLDTSDRVKNFDANAEKQKAQNYEKYNVNPKTAQGTQNNPIDLTKIPYEKIGPMPAGTYITYPDPNNPGKMITTTRKADERNTPAMQGQQPQQQAPYPVQQEAFAPPPQM